MQTVVSNSSPIIILAKTENMSLFTNVFNNVIIPQTVYNEIVSKKDIAAKQLKSAKFITVSQVNNSDTLQNLYAILDKGEAEAIALAKELDLLLIIDEKKGRNIARNFDLKIIGFLGVLFLNYQNKFLGKNDVIQIVKQADDFGYRLSNTLKTDFLNSL